MKSFLVLCLFAIVLEVSYSNELEKKSKASKASKTLYSLYIKPQNVAEEAGTTALLTCWSDNTANGRIMWTEFATNPSGALISDGANVLPSYVNSDRYRIIHDDPEQWDLEIGNVELGDGGLFLCQDANLAVGEFRGKAENTVLAGPTNCTTTIGNGVIFEGSTYTLECEIILQGNQKPILTWSGPGDYSTTTGNTVNSEWSLLIFTAVRTQEDGIFSCLTNFTELLPPADNDSATNAPPYENTYFSVPLQVRWPPKNMYAEPVKPSYVLGEMITCYADANPNATFLWQNTRTGQTVSLNETFVVDETYEGYTTAMRCEARNTISDTLYTINYFFNVTCPAKTTTTPTTTTPTTTTPLPEADCNEITGRWNSITPPIAVCFEVDTNTGFVFGVARNGSDGFYVEIDGYTIMDQFTYIGFCGIWPFDTSVFCFAAECHMCYGIENMTANAIERSISARPACGTASAERIYPQPFYFQRTGPSCRGAELRVKNPTHITRDLGIKVVTGDETWPAGFPESKSQSGISH